MIIKIPSDIRRMREVSLKILGSLKSYDLDNDRMFDIRLAVEEAVRNAIIHGNESDKAKSVTITYWIEDDKINVVVEDEGKGFDPLGLPDPTANDNIMKNSGRGVYLVKKLMDEVEFNAIGNKLKMTKKLK
ncbi:MAG: hypothetical protein A2987_06710 [Omnitrophica bacterium RIFCSPLOWO2_01_FULL_45_10]|nr:MAG: hypothetical protein A2987_06710 [Omnitrophica bacterium RIFCSPLOWO2_01_FULL_45_10]